MRFEQYLGEYIAGYRLVKLIGYGKMGGVFRGVRPSQAEDAAIKIIVDHLSHDEVFAAHFRKELASNRALQHPNILPVWEWGVEQGRLYVMMPLVAGGNLHTRMETGGIGRLRSLMVIVQIARALQQAHQRQIVHGNINPGNVLYDRDRKIYLNDFGLTPALWESAHLKGTEIPLTTPHYISPEAGRGHPIDSRSDVYSLGALLYKLLTGFTPFNGQTHGEIVLHHIQSPLPDPRQIHERISPSVTGVIYRAMAKNPDDRYPNAGAFADALDEAAQQS